MSKIVIDTENVLKSSSYLNNCIMLLSDAHQSMYSTTNMLSQNVLNRRNIQGQIQSICNQIITLQQNILEINRTVNYACYNYLEAENQLIQTAYEINGVAKKSLNELAFEIDTETKSTKESSSKYRIKKFSSPALSSNSYIRSKVKVRNLKLGSKGNDVVLLQKLLKKCGYNLKIDGIYGNQTATAIKDFQRKHNLQPDGIVGEITRKALNTFILGSIVSGVQSNAHIESENNSQQQESTHVPQSGNNNSEITSSAEHNQKLVVDLLKKCVQKNSITYAHTSSTMLTDKNGNVKDNLKLDCSYFVSSVYKTCFGEKYDLTKYYDEVPNSQGRGSTRISQMGKEVQGFKDSKGNIDYSKLKPGDILCMDYERTGKEYEHVMIYIGEGKYIDVATKGCSINTSSSLNGAEQKDINQLHWTKPFNGDIKDHIMTVRRIIQDDGSLYIL